MECPNCRAQLSAVTYEGIEVETCTACAGEWLDSDELGKIVRIRQEKFSEEERRAIAESTSLTGVILAHVDRDLVCPKCGGSTDAVNYGGDTGIIIDRCTSCAGFWLDGDELEKIQALVEGWEDKLPEDLKKYGPQLREVAAKVDREDDVEISQLPLIGPFINSVINGILDLKS